MTPRFYYHWRDPLIHHAATLADPAILAERLDLFLFSMRYILI